MMQENTIYTEHPVQYPGKSHKLAENLTVSTDAFLEELCGKTSRSNISIKYFLTVLEFL